MGRDPELQLGHPGLDAGQREQRCPGFPIVHRPGRLVGQLVEEVLDLAGSDRDRVSPMPGRCGVGHGSIQASSTDSRGSESGVVHRPSGHGRVTTFPLYYRGFEARGGSAPGAVLAPQPPSLAQLTLTEHKPTTGRRPPDRRKSPAGGGLVKGAKRRSEPLTSPSEADTIAPSGGRRPPRNAVICRGVSRLGRGRPRTSPPCSAPNKPARGEPEPPRTRAPERRPRRGPSEEGQGDEDTTTRGRGGARLGCDPPAAVVRRGARPGGDRRAVHGERRRWSGDRGRAGDLAELAAPAAGGGVRRVDVRSVRHLLAPWGCSTSTPTGRAGGSGLPPPPRSSRSSPACGPHCRRATCHAVSVSRGSPVPVRISTDAMSSRLAAVAAVSRIDLPGRAFQVATCSTLPVVGDDEHRVGPLRGVGPGLGWRRVAAGQVQARAPRDAGQRQVRGHHLGADHLHGLADRGRGRRRASSPTSARSPATRRRR